MKKYTLFLLVLMMTSCGNSTLKCGDLLEQYASKPPNLEFVECEKGSGQTLVTATYRVKGEHVEEIERFLVDTYGMGELKFGCCGWESGGRTGSFENKRLKDKDSSYIGVVSMYGNAVNNEAGEIIDRTDIPIFYVIVAIESI